MKNNYSRLKWVALIIVGGILLFLAQTAFAGNKSLLITSFPQEQITGKVTDKDGSPLIGVTVMLKGSNTGTITNLEGNYNLSVAENSTLVFSFIGYKTLEVPLNGEKEVDVQLEEDISSLDEVQINAGYYNTTKRESTGNISRVTAAEIELQPVISPLQALQGRVAGLVITPGGSHPGMASTIRIRGQNSLREDGNFPLYIIDGVPINSTPIESNSLLGSSGIDPLNNLSVNNIESIEVLKDADATAIYGSRGANGVILITTKNGIGKHAGLEGQIYIGAATIPNRLDLMDTQEYLAMRRQAFVNDDLEPNQYNAYDLVLWDQNRYTDWQDYAFGGTSKTTNVSLAYSGGSENTSFRVGGSFFTQGTVYPADYSYQKITGSLNLTHHSENEKFRMNLSLNYGLDDNNLVGNLNLNSSVFLLPPNAPSIFNDDGSLNWEEWGEAGLNNPFEGYFNTTLTHTNSLISNLGLSYQLLDGIQLKSSFGYTNFTSDELLKLPARSYNPAFGVPNNSFQLNVNRRSWIVEPQIVLEKEFQRLKVDGIIGATIQQNISTKQSFQGSGYASEAFIGNLAAAESILNATSENSEYHYAALFSRLGLNWDKKYYLNLTGRRDGSSRFGSNNRFANFWAIGSAWIFTEESFMEDYLSFLSFGKIRGSYGTTGNDQIGDYGYLDIYEATQGAGGLYPTSLANPNFSWEINKKLEFGIELGLVKNKVTAGLSYFRNRSTNQLVGYPLPAITGFGSVQANLPATVENSGWEIEASSKNLSTKNFYWQTSFNLSVPTNKLIRYPNLDQSSYANVYREGYPLNISLRYQYDGLDPDSGFYIVKDINEDGSLDFKDRILVQDQSRNYYGGINNSLAYKAFSLQFLIEFVKQEGSQPLFYTGTLNNTLSGLVGNSNYQRISQSYEANIAYSYASESLFPIEDASFLRLKTISLGYNIPETIIKKVGASSGKIFINGQNLLTFTPYSGLDPEFPYSGTGIGSSRTITGGFQINL